VSLSKTFTHFFHQTTDLSYVNLNYDKIKRRHDEGSHTWTSYSDLFLVLSVVFLLLFTVANIRSGTMSVSQQAQLQAAKEKAEAMEKQIKAYDVLKEDYVKNGASQDEIQVYHDLMDHMDLLTDAAKKERDEANQKAKDANEKAKNLNYYQALVKNIINANLVAGGKVKHRDMMIGEKDNDIQGLESTVKTQESTISTNNEKIVTIEDNLQKQIKETRYAYRSKKNGEAKAEAAIAKLEADSKQRVAALQQENVQAATQLDQTKAQLQAKNQEAQNLATTLTQKEAQFKSNIEGMEQQHAQEIAAEKAAFDKSMNELKLSDEQRIAQEKAYAAGQEAKNKQYQQKLAGMNDELAKTRNGIKDIESKYQGSINSLQAANQQTAAQLAQAKAFGAGKDAEAKAYQDKLAGMNKEVGNLKNGLQALSDQNKGLGADLAASQRKLNEQKILAEQITKNFQRAGIDASVNGKTGDVVINFQGEYFATGSADLKNGMKSILEKTFPVYAKSLMENKAIANRIGSVEIVGFASPTYKGKSVDPNGLTAESRAAVNYNMDLSYQRAKAIFEHVFDTSQMQFEHQKALLPLVKVSGRSYLATDKIPGRSTAALEQGADYCSVFDCKKSQRVIIKFNLKEE
jgi:hypothetical protein